MGDRRGAYRVLLGYLREDLGRPTRRCKDTIKTDFQEVVWWGMDLIDLVQDSDRWRTVVYAVMNLRFL